MGPNPAAEANMPYGSNACILQLFYVFLSTPSIPDAIQTQALPSFYSGSLQ